MSASDTERRAKASNANRTATIMPIRVIARWVSQGAVSQERVSAAGSPCSASAEEHAANSKMLERRARTISEIPARRGRWTRLGARWTPAHSQDPPQTHVTEAPHEAV